MGTLEPTILFKSISSNRSNKKQHLLWIASLYCMQITFEKKHSPKSTSDVRLNIIGTFIKPIGINIGYYDNTQKTRLERFTRL